MRFIVLGSSFIITPCCIDSVCILAQKVNVLQPKCLFGVSRVSTLIDIISNDDMRVWSGMRKIFYVLEV